MIKRYRKITGSSNPEEEVEVDIESGLHDWINFDIFYKHFHNHPSYSLHQVDDSTAAIESSFQATDDIENSDESHGSRPSSSRSTTAGVESDVEEEEDEVEEDYLPVLPSAKHAEKGKETRKASMNVEEKMEGCQINWLEKTKNVRE